MIFINLLVIISSVFPRETNAFVPSMQPSVSVSFMPQSSQIDIFNKSLSSQSPSMVKTMLSTFMNNTSPSLAPATINNHQFSLAPSISNTTYRKSDEDDSSMNKNMSSLSPDWASDIHVIFTFSYKAPISTTSILSKSDHNAFVTDRLNSLISNQAFDSKVRVKKVETSIVENYDYCVTCYTIISRVILTHLTSITSDQTRTLIYSLGQNITEGNPTLNYMEPDVLSTELQLVLEGIFLKDIQTNEDFKVNQTFFKLSEETIIKFLNSKVPTKITFPFSVISVRVGDPTLEKEEDRHRTRTHLLISETKSNIRTDDADAHKSSFMSISLQLNIKGVYPTFVQEDFERIVHNSLDVHATELASEFTHALIDYSIRGKIERILYFPINPTDDVIDNNPALNNTELLILICFTCITSLYLILQIQRARSSDANSDRSGFCTLTTAPATSSSGILKMFGRQSNKKIEFPVVQNVNQAPNVNKHVNDDIEKAEDVGVMSTAREVAVSGDVSVASSITKSTFFGGGHIRNGKHPHRWNVMMANKASANENGSAGSAKSFKNKAMSWTNLLFSTKSINHDNDRALQAHRFSLDQENYFNSHEEDEFKEHSHRVNSTNDNNGHLQMNQTQDMEDDIRGMKYNRMNYMNLSDSVLHAKNDEDIEMSLVSNQRRYSLPNQSMRNIHQLQSENNIERPPMRKSFSSFNSILKNELRISSKVGDVDDRNEELNALWEPEENSSPQRQREEVVTLENMLRQESKVFGRKSMTALMGEQEESDNYVRSININKRLSMESSVCSIQDSHQNQSEKNSLGRGSRSENSGKRNMGNSSSRGSRSENSGNGSGAVRSRKTPTLSSSTRTFSIHNSNRNSIISEKTGVRSNNSSIRKSLLSAESKTSSKSSRFRSLVRGDSLRRFVNKQRRYSSSDLNKKKRDQNMYRTQSENIIPSHISVLARSVGSRNLLATDSVTNAHIPKTLMESKDEQNYYSDESNSTITTIDSISKSIRDGLLAEREQALNKEHGHFEESKRNSVTSANKPPRQPEENLNEANSRDHLQKTRGFSSDLPLKKHNRQDTRMGGIHRIPSEISVVSRSSSSRNLLATSTAVMSKAPKNLKNLNMEKVLEEDSNHVAHQNDSYVRRHKSILSTPSMSARQRSIRMKEMCRRESMPALLSQNQSDLFVESESSKKSSLSDSKSTSTNSSISSLDDDSVTKNKEKNNFTNKKKMDSPGKRRTKDSAPDPKKIEEQRSTENQRTDSLEDKQLLKSFVNVTSNDMRGSGRYNRQRSSSEADMTKYHSSYGLGNSRFSYDWERSVSTNFMDHNHAPYEAKSITSKSAKEIRKERRKERIRMLTENSRHDSESLISRSNHSRDLFADGSVAKSTTSSKLASSERGLSQYMIQQRRSLHNPEIGSLENLLRRESINGNVFVATKEGDQTQAQQSSKLMREEHRRERLRKLSQRTMPLLSSQKSEEFPDNEELISRQSKSRNLLTDTSATRPTSTLNLSASEKGMSTHLKELRRSSLDSEFSLDFRIDENGKDSLQQLLKKESKKLDMRIQKYSKDWSPDLLSKIFCDDSDDGSTKEYLTVFDPAFKAAQEQLMAKDTNEVLEKIPKRKRKLSLPYLPGRSPSLKGIIFGKGKSEQNLIKEKSDSQDKTRKDRIV